jgi:hypothetical protein
MAAQSESIELAGIEDGKAPKTRLSDADKAALIVDQLIRANAKRSEVNARVKSSLDGNPPYDPGVLRRNSQSHRTNVNFREAEGISNAAVSPFYDLFAESPWYCEVQCDYGEESDRIDFSKKVTKHFDRMLKEWDRFDFNMQLMIKDRTDFGPGFFMWPDSDTWRPKVVKYSKVLVPDGSMASIDEDLELIVVREAYPLVELWKKIRNANAARAAGWNRKAVLREMFYATPEGQANTRDADFYEWYQQKLRNNDICESVRSSTVAAAHLLVKEYDGRISHQIVSEKCVPKSLPGQSAPDGTKKSEFLFQRIGQFESFRQVLAAFFYDIGDGTWHSVKGLLVKLYPFVALKDRLNCATVDNAFLNMSVLVKALNKGATADLQLFQMGYMTVLPPDIEVQQWGIAGRMEEGLAVERHLDNKLSGNIGQYRPRGKKENGNPITATEAMANESKEAMLSKSAVNRFYGELDFFYEEMYRRATNRKLRPDTEANQAALAFQKRCIADGVPPEALSQFRSVRAYRNIGNGSIFMRQAAFRDMAAIVPMLNEEGRTNWLDDAIATLTSQDMVSRYNPKPEQMTGTADQANLALLENAALREGAPIMVTPTQNHVVHADIHLKAASDAAKSLQQGADPMQVLAFLESVGPHVRQHLDQFANDPTRVQQYKALESTWKKTATFTNQLHGRVEQMQAQQQQARQRQNGAMSEEQIKEFKAQRDAERKDRKQQTDERLKTEKTRFGMDLQAATTRQKMAIADVTTAQKIQTDKAKEAASSKEK